MKKTLLAFAAGLLLGGLMNVSAQDAPKKITPVQTEPVLFSDATLQEIDAILEEQLGIKRAERLPLVKEMKENAKATTLYDTALLVQVIVEVMKHNNETNTIKNSNADTALQSLNSRLDAIAQIHNHNVKAIVDWSGNFATVNAIEGAQLAPTSND